LRKVQPYLSAPTADLGAKVGNQTGSWRVRKTMNAIGGVQELGSLELPATSFDEFFALTQPRMLRLAVALVSSRSLAEDIVQDAFAACYARFASLKQPEAYVRRCVVNRAHGVFRRRRVARDKEPILHDAPHHQEYDTLLAVLDRLPTRQRAALILRYYEQCSEQEIAAALRCRPGTVKSLLSRGLAALREVVEP
jgi:RNA polymerase sigma-70 factor (sigma-E family)